MPYRSFFSYSVTRAYPLRWFTPTVIIGGIIATALVSFLNVAATGYELVPTSTSDPNSTETNGVWFSKWPSYLVGARASCDAANLQVQSTIYTDKRAFPYTLSRVWQLGDGGQEVYQGSMVYKNNPIQKCNVTLIKMEFEGPGRTAGQLAVAPMGGTVTATSQCYVDEGTPSGRTYFELLSTYDAIPGPRTVSSAFLSLNKTTNPSLYWGYSLLNVYWRTVMQSFFDEDMARTEAPFFKGNVDLQRNMTLKGTMEENVQNVEFLRVPACWFIPLNTTGVAYLENRYCNSSSITELANSPHPAAFERPVPNIWHPVGILGKAMWFTVLADLGRDDDDMPNMLARPDLLANLTSNMNEANSTLRKTFRWGLESSLISQKGFDPAQSQDVHLWVNQSQLVADYLCQVPQLKSAGNLFLSVLVADLVILQVIWKIFTLLVDKICIKDTEEAQYCAACAPVPQSVQAAGGYQSVIGQDSKAILLEERRSLGT